MKWQPGHHRQIIWVEYFFSFFFFFFSKGNSFILTNIIDSSLMIRDLKASLYKLKNLCIIFNFLFLSVFV